MIPKPAPKTTTQDRLNRLTDALACAKEDLEIVQFQIDTIQDRRDSEEKGDNDPC
jgi:hypothetical protein